MNMTLLIRSLQSRKQATFLVVLLWVVLVVWPALTRAAVVGQQEKQSNPQSAIRNLQSQTAFTYQGQLKEGDLAATGSFDFQFTLYTAQTGGDELGSFLREGTILTNGLFKVSLDFGRAPASGQETWLEIAVRPSGSAESYTVLSPRQRLTPTPYAIFAQQERWSLIGVPVGIAGDGKKNSDFTDEVAALGTTKDFIPKFTDNVFVPLTESVMFESGGNVGVGTTTPTQKLDVAGTVKATAFLGDGSALTGINDNKKVAKAGDTMTGILNLPANGLVAGTNQLVLASNRVAIGTTSPNVKLHIEGGTSASPTGGGFLQLGSSTGANLALDNNLIMARSNGATATLVLNSSSSFIITPTGDVRIGGAASQSKLTVQAATDETAVFGISTSRSAVAGRSDSGDGVTGNSVSGTAVLGTSISGRGGAFVNGGGVAGNNTTEPALEATNLGSGPAASFRINKPDNPSIIEARTGAPPGNLRFRVHNNGNVTADGTFTGGGADFADMMEIEASSGQEVDAYQPGDVLVISPETGRLRKGDQPYCSLVAGVYSTKPGFLAGQGIEENEKPQGQKVPLALVGQAPCKVTTENGPIQIGDLLVTSSTPGYAMKGSDRTRMLGAIVGKALEPLASGAGTIRVLVMLQ